jgi:hypothetical protein
MFADDDSQAVQESRNHEANTAPQHHWETQPSQRAYRLFERPKPLPAHFPNSSAAALAAIADAGGIYQQLLNASSARRDQVLRKTLSFHCNF